MMLVPKTDLCTKYKQRCQKLQQEQAKTARLIRRYMQLNNVFNPFSGKSKINNILKQYEKSFWA